MDTALIVIMVAAMIVVTGFVWWFENRPEKEGEEAASDSASEDTFDRESAASAMADTVITADAGAKTPEHSGSGKAGGRKTKTGKKKGGRR